MKLTLVLLVAMVAVAIEAMDLSRSRRESGMDLDEGSADAAGFGEGLKIKSGVIASKGSRGGQVLSLAEGTAKNGSLYTSNYLGHVAIRHFDEKPKKEEEEDTSEKESKVEEEEEEKSEEPKGEVEEEEKTKSEKEPMSEEKKSEEEPKSESEAGARPAVE